MGVFKNPCVMPIEEHDIFSAQIAELVAFGEPMEWQDDETITFAYSRSHEMMDDERLELPMDPAREFQYLKDMENKDVARKKEAERVRLYGNDPRIMNMLCTETSADLEKTLARMHRGDFLHKQIRVMNQLRKEEKYEQATAMGVWLLHQDEKDGVAYNKELLHILKETVRELCDKVAFLQKERVK
jgi:hypothetical protein